MNKKLTLYPKYVKSKASVNDISAKNNCTPHSSTGRFTHRMASQLMMGFSWNSSSVSVADSKNSVLLPTVHAKLWRREIHFFFFYFSIVVFLINNTALYKVVTYHVANVGSRSVITRNIYRKQVSNLKNKLTIRIRRPVRCFCC